MLTILRPLSTSELLDQTFHLHKNDRYILLAVSDFVSKSLVGPLLTLLYDDQRVRKEGFALQLMMSNLESAAPAAATVSAS
jgi:hypothetical protein